MFSFTETISIDARADVVWRELQDVERWWPPSNPEHDSIERLDGQGIEPGTRIRIRERVAGIPCEATGVITDVVPGVEASWEAPQARYSWLGLTITVGEGVTWRVEPDGADASTLSAHVWATFAPSLFGRFLGWTFQYILRGVTKDRRHARAELEYLKATAERGDPS
jgi:Polyketide cyclase / dehydrase and lipid transport